MKQLGLFLFISVLLTISGRTQSLDFGLEFRANFNSLGFNKYVELDAPDISSPGYYNGDPYNLLMPPHHHEFIMSDSGSIFGYWTQATANNTFSVPLSVRYTTKRGWFFNVRASVEKYKLNFSGRLHRDPQHYINAYGDFDEYVTNYGGSFADENPNLDYESTYNDTTAFITYFANSVASDPVSRLEMRRVEELKFYSFFFSFGKKFFSHKVIRPYLTVGMGYKIWVGNQKRQYIELGDQVLDSPYFQDFLGAGQQIHLFNTNAVSTRFEGGFEFYRYYFGASYEITSTFNHDNKNSNHPELVPRYATVIDGMSTFSIYLGVNLFGKDFRAKEAQKEIYEDEYSTLTSKVDNIRRFGVLARVKSPLTALIANYGTHYIGDFTDVPDPTTNTLKRKIHLLEFNNVNNINWSPKFELGFRYSPVSRLETELEVGIQHLTLDTGVDDFSGLIIEDTITSGLVYEDGSRYRNAATFRLKFFDLTSKLNLYYTIVKKDLWSLKLFAGAGYNFIIPPGSDVQRDFGVNGDGEDVYARLEDYYWGNLEDNYNGFTFYSEYSETSDPGGDNDASAIIEKLQDAGWGEISTWDRTRNFGYLTTNFGVEAELNRFLLGAGVELTLGEVDGVFIKSYQKLNLSLGYMLFSKNGINRKTSKTNF